MQQQEVTEDSLTFLALLFLRHPDIQSDVWATPPPHTVLNLRTSILGRLTSAARCYPSTCPQSGRIKSGLMIDLIVERCATLTPLPPRPVTVYFI